MKPFQIVPAISFYDTFQDFAAQADIGPEDLIFTNERLYENVIRNADPGCQLLFRSKYGAGEPTDQMINQMLKDLAGRKYRKLIAAGGGSIVDIAKVLAVAETEDTVDQLYDRMPDGLHKVHPLIILPATCGTGSEVTNLSIINRVSLGVKQGLLSASMFADQAVLIPELLQTVPYQVFATSSTDALVHAVESFLSPNASPFSEMYSEKAISMILQSWTETSAAADPEYWKSCGDRLLLASCYAGIAFGNAGCAAVHALSYPLGSVYHIPHGQANQLMFAEVMRKYQEKQPCGKLNRLEQIIANEMQVAPEEAMKSLYALMEGILAKKQLRSFGVTREDLSTFTENVLATQQRLLGNNYVELTREDILSIYERSW